MSLVRRELRSWNESFSLESMPHDPLAFSYWVVSSLPLDDSMKITLLAVNSATQRLRAELHVMRAVRALRFFFVMQCPMWARGNPTFPPSTLSFSIFYFSFHFPFSYSLHIFSCFSIPSHFARLVPVRFQAGCRRRWLNRALIFVCVDYVLYVLFS